MCVDCRSTHIHHRRFGYVACVFILFFHFRFVRSLVCLKTRDYLRALWFPNMIFTFHSRRRRYENERWVSDVWICVYLFSARWQKISCKNTLTRREKKWKHPTLWYTSKLRTHSLCRIEHCSSFFSPFYLFGFAHRLSHCACASYIWFYVLLVWLCSSHCRCPGMCVKSFSLCSISTRDDVRFAKVKKKFHS